MYFLNLSFLQFLAVFGIHLRHIGSALPAGPLAPQTGGFDSPLLGRRRTTRRGRAPQAHPAAVVAAAATGFDGAADPGDCATAAGHARGRRPRSRHRARYLVLDGGPQRKPDPDGRCQGPRPPVPARAARARPGDAGARRWNTDTGDRLRTRSPESGSRDPGVAARFHRPQSGPGAGVRPPHPGAGRAARRRNRVHRSRAYRAARPGHRTRAAAQPPRDRDSGQRGKRRAAQDRHAPRRRRFRYLGDLRFGAQLRHAAAHRAPGARFRPAGKGRTRGGGSAIPDTACRRRAGCHL